MRNSRLELEVGGIHPQAISGTVRSKMNEGLSAVCFAAIQGNNLLISFFTSKKTFFTSTNVIFNIFTYAHPFCIFNQKYP